MSGSTEHGGGREKDGIIDGHLFNNYRNIFDKSKGDNGYIAPGKDIHNEKIGG